MLIKKLKMSRERKHASLLRKLDKKPYNSHYQIVPD